jgi:membrane-associated phospholipid phosphatase
VEHDRDKLVKTARIVSIAGHPFVLIPTTTLIAALYNMPPQRAFAVVAVTVSITVLPILFIIRRKVTAEKWSDYDVSIASERKSFYPILILIVSISSLILWLLRFPRSLLLGIVISLGLIFAAMLINLRSKISLHLIFAVYCAVSLMAVSGWLGAGFLLFAAAIGWSRIVLQRHNFGQVVSGMTLGAAAGILLLKLLDFI